MRHTPLLSTLSCILSLGALLSACQREATQAQAPLQAPSEAQAKQKSTTQQAPLTLEEKAKALLAEAWRHEREVTPLLKRLAQEQGGRMVGLKYRLKSEGSTLRKLKKLISENPSLTPQTVTIYDALRYTMEFKDDPKGSYVKGVHDTLVALEKKGHRVKVVKNYWKRGDNYSGVNSVLSYEGFEWELQFHTPASVQEAHRSHKQYEELRAEGTTPERKQELFQEMSAPWDQIPLPAHVLDEKNLHQTELIKTLPAPSPAP
jgi:hypothetical protein